MELLHVVKTCANPMIGSFGVCFVRDARNFSDPNKRSRQRDAGVDCGCEEGKQVKPGLQEQRRPQEPEVPTGGAQDHLLSSLVNSSAARIVAEEAHL